MASMHAPRETDVLIIGAGAAGAAAAWRLATNGIAVTCLEQGDWVDPLRAPTLDADWERIRQGAWHPNPNIRRARADYPIDSLPSEGAKVVARAMQKYGMYHADGGNIALTAQSDRHTTAKWQNVLGPLDLQSLQVSDFEVIDHGSMSPVGDCNR